MPTEPLPIPEEYQVGTIIGIQAPHSGVGLHKISPTTFTPIKERNDVTPDHWCISVGREVKFGLVIRRHEDDYFKYIDVLFGDSIGRLFGTTFQVIHHIHMTAQEVERNWNSGDY